MAELIQTKNDAQILNPVAIEGLIEEKLGEILIFKDIFPTVITDRRAFTYFKDVKSVTEDIMDGTQGRPSITGEVGALSEISVSEIEAEYGSVQEAGYKMTFSKRDLEDPAIVDELNRAINRAAYGISYEINNKILKTIMTTDNDVEEYVAPIKWDKDGANPVEDILNILESCKVPGYPYGLTDLYLHQTNYFELARYASNVPNVPWTRSPFGDSVDIPTINGVNIHNLGQLTLPEGSYIGLDTQNPGITLYNYLDKEAKTVEGIINLNQYTEIAHPKNTVTEFYYEIGYAPKLPNALYYAKDAI